ncbi:protein kintoun [Phymastichus coffea]|uniref:protein kintoun n=1 Tax=Phymastichus coffea TaxID=108790 RepID=UPI00273C9D0F|nr:protein kintoun [Phymastichus coffea]
MDAYEEQRKRDWEELEVTKDELKALTDCMKKEEFRQLLREYADEVTDPENRARYEAEITQLERERGIQVTFVKPQPGYVLKTSLDGRSKCFINVTKNECVDKPSHQPAAVDNGLSWSIPHVLSPPRDDLDKKHVRCRVFDVVFHPDTLHLAERNSRFRKIVNDTAMDGVEKNFKVKLDRKNVKFPKMNYKGVSLPTVLRKPCEKPAEKLDIEPDIYQKLISSYDAEREKRLKLTEKKPAKAPPTTKYFHTRDIKTENESQYTIPTFFIKHQSNIDMDEFMETKDAKMHVATPKNLVIIINLPLLKSAADATLDVQDRHLSLKSERPAKYHLELPLSYKVDPDKGNAKFDSKLKKLTVTLPVIRDVSVLADTKEDSGVESDHGSPVPESKMNGNHEESEDSSDSIKLPDSSIDKSNGDKVDIDCDDAALRTSESGELSENFMNPYLKYSLPAFTCNLYDDVLAITIHIKNVDAESIQHTTLENDAGLHILLTSIGAGFFPVYYSLCLKVDNNEIIPDTLTTEPWDNNVVISVKIKNPKYLSRYFAGIDEKNMEAKELFIAASIKNKLQALVEDPELETDKNVEVIRKGTEVIVSVGSQSLDSDDEDEHHEDESELQSQEEERKKQFIQSRSVSESSGDELPSSIGSNSSTRHKSILKSRFSRSISESSIDDSTAALSMVTFNDFIHEFNSESEGSSLKKTVRFNDVVSRQLYRSNSSILGQRKKNQRKLRNKKRAHERRMSESENSEGEEKYKLEVKAQLEQNTPDVRPILHQTNKRTEKQKTANMEIERSPRSANKRKQKRNSENTVVTKDMENAKTDNHSDIESEAECKSDLLFELDM